MSHCLLLSAPICDSVAAVSPLSLHNDWLGDSPPTTPVRSRNAPLADIFNLLQEISPSKSDRAIRGVKEVLLNTAEDAFTEQNTEIAQLSNKVLPATSRKRRRRFHRAHDADEAVDNPNTLEERVRKAGRRFTVDDGLYFVDEEAVLTGEVDEEFDLSTEFDSNENRIQARIHDIDRISPKEARSIRTEDWIIGAYMDASLRHLAEANELADFVSSNRRFQAFKDRIGYVQATDTHGAHYSAFTAAILYDEFHGEVDVASSATLFCSRYTRASRSLHRPSLFHPRRYFSPRRTDPIPAQAIWLYSADTKFLERGDQTGIYYAQRYLDYIERIRQGLNENKPWAVELLKHWDDVMFPNAEDSPADAMGVDDVVAAERRAVDAAFKDAPSGRDSPKVCQTAQAATTTSKVPAAVAATSPSSSATVTVPASLPILPPSPSSPVNQSIASTKPAPTGRAERSTQSKELA
ncbi:hypothetical protein R3P38DRAFT_3425938 [Favolaschia claudopus]|uniref:Uncharacterized protein n=1 Tax=Favolaschia claudopus TaxID=2862362 RepID=A0AAV9ZYF7_9AGAR